MLNLNTTEALQPGEEDKKIESQQIKEETILLIKKLNELKKLLGEL
jgi:hypothetical protein